MFKKKKKKKKKKRKKENLNINTKYIFIKVFDDEVFTWKLIRPNLLFCIAIDL